MDTHMNPDPDPERREPTFSAALPSELRGSNGGDREEAMPDIGEVPASADGGSVEVKPARRRHRLLLGVAAVALVGVGGTLFLASPYNQMYPVPRLASAVRGLAEQAAFPKPAVLAPSASLAGINAPLPPPKIVQKYAGEPRDAQLREVLGFHVGEPGTSAAPAPATGDAWAWRGGPPRGYVPAEPGLVGAAGGAAGHVPDLTASLVAGMRGGDPGQRPAPAPGGDSEAAPASAAPSLPTPARLPHPLSVAAVAPSVLPAASPPVSPSAAAAPAPSPQDPVAKALALQAAPMSSAAQVDVLQTVTQLATLLRDLRAETDQLRRDVARANADDTARIEDFSRRLTLSEARKALTGAEQLAPLDPPPATEIAAPAAPAPSARKPAVTLAKLTVGSTPVTGSSEGSRYRVQAASPGLAMLAEVDRGGGDGAQLSVQVGDNLPGYGRVKSVSQRGTSWVVMTEHGTIGQ